MYICEICGTKFSSDESEADLLIGLLTDLRGYLAAGQWAHARYVLLLFLVTQISQMTQIFLRGIIFVPQISQIYIDFSSWDYFVPQISQIYTDFSSWDYFVPQISQIYTDFFESQVNRFVRSQGVSVTTEQVASAKFRVIR